MRPWRRAVQLVGGLLAFTLSMAMLLHAGQGAMPWDVLHQGLARTTGWSLGAVVAICSVLVLAAWVPLRGRPGVGTVANVVVIAVAIEPCLALVELVVGTPTVLGGVALALGGIVLNGVATVAYVGVHLGPGPRDGLLTGIVARTGWSVGAVKTGIEVTVVGLGWVLGGTLGWATLAFALGVGVVVQAAGRWRWLVPDGLVAERPDRRAAPRAQEVPLSTELVEHRARVRTAQIDRALAVIREDHGEGSGRSVR